MKKGFTLIELLVVSTIIALLTSIGAVSYSQFLKNSRDGRRKADLEQIRMAIEQYKADVDGYPPSNKLNLSSCTFSSLENGGNTYLSTVPNDPNCSKGYYYFYQATPTSCDNSSSFCTDYTICAYLEGGGTSTSYSCGAKNCNYCLGPYGEK